MNHTFAQVPKAEIQRSSFNRSHTLKTTFDSGYLIPVFVDEALPGDTFNLRMSTFARLATPIVPYMDNVYLDTFFFAVPYRLVWDNWQKFNGEQIDPGDSTDYLIPQTSMPLVGSTYGYAIGSLSDYMGLPAGRTDYEFPLSHSSLWHRAYNLIWNEWYRDQNLQDSLPVPKGDGPDASTLFTLQRRGKRHDYFTSCLPFPQKGPAVELPLGTTAPVISDGTNPTMHTLNALTPPRAFRIQGSTNLAYMAGTGIAGDSNVIWDNAGLEVDLSDATAATINSLRQAFQIQKLYERDARGGTRYTEIIKAHFGVTSPDARLQRPEYLGGGSTPINVHPIAQTSESGETPQANLAAFATSSSNGQGFVKSFTEHTLLLGFVSVRADMTYQQGLNRMWSRRGRFDFFWPALAHLGEQSVLNKEIFYSGVEVQDEGVFGYQERFGEYRYKPSQITGQFRSDAPQSLDVWHLAQDFASTPPLNASFIQENPPLDRVIAVPSEPQFLFDSYFDINCARPMPVYGVPGLVDHF